MKETLTEVITSFGENLSPEEKTNDISPVLNALIKEAEALPETGKTVILPVKEAEYNARAYRLHFQVIKGPLRHFTKAPTPEYAVQVWVDSPSFKNGSKLRRLNTAYGLWSCKADPEELLKTMERACDKLESVKAMHDIEKTFRIEEIENSKAPATAHVTVTWDAANENTRYQTRDQIYSMYQLDWMITHGYGLHDLVKSMEGYRRESEPEEGFSSVIELAANWEYENGFNGSLWVSREEFLDAEYQDPAYINALIPQFDHKLRKQWEQDTGKKLPYPVRDKKAQKSTAR